MYIKVIQYTPASEYRTATVCTKNTFTNLTERQFTQTVHYQHVHQHYVNLFYSGHFDNAFEGNSVCGTLFNETDY